MRAMQIPLDPPFPKGEVNFNGKSGASSVYGNSKTAERKLRYQINLGRVCVLNAGCQFATAVGTPLPNDSIYHFRRNIHPRLLINLHHTSR